MTSASDSFTRANETPVASPWSSVIGSGVNLTSNVLTSTASTDKSSLYTGTFGNCQEASVKVGALSGSNQYASVCVRMSGSGVTANYWEFGTDGVTGTAHSYFGKWTNGVFSEEAAIATTVANGDTIKLTVTGQTPNIVLTAFKNGSQVAQITGRSGANSGNPGVGAFGVATDDDFIGTDGAGDAGARISNPAAQPMIRGPM